MKTISSQEFADKVKTEQVLIFDVRDYDEYLNKHIPNSKLVPLDEFETHIAEIPSDKEVYLICQCGNRSAKALRMLESVGRNNIFNVLGGIDGFEKHGGIVHRQTKSISISRQAQITYGILILIGIILAKYVHINFMWFSAVIAAALIIAGVSGFCIITAILIKLPWNKDYKT